MQQVNVPWDLRRLRVFARRRCRQLWQAFRASLALPFCPSCGEPVLERELGNPCTDCAEELFRLQPGQDSWIVTKNRVRLASDASPSARQGGLRVDAVFAYRGSAGSMVRRAKFLGDRTALGYLGRALAKRHAAGAGVLVVPVPLSRGRRRLRGFNQAEEFARFLVRAGAGRLCPRALRRVRETLPQGQMPGGSRERNLRGAFATGWQGWRVRGRVVLLVDDVVTSGTTLRECRAVLRAAGARRVSALCVASALPHGP